MRLPCLPGAILGATLALASAAAPPSTTEAPKAAPAASAPAVPLKVVGREITRFRATVFGYGPGERMESAKVRLLAAYERNHHPVLAARHSPEGTQVLADRFVMFVIVPGDLDPISGDTPEAASARAIDALNTVLDDLHRRDDPAALATGGALALAATLLAYLLIRLTFSLDRRAGVWFAQRVARRVQRVQVSGVSMLEASTWLRFARSVAHGFAWLVAGILAFLWLNAVLQAVPYTRPWGEQLTAMLEQVLATIGNGLADALPGLLFVVVILVIARLVTRVAAAFFERVIERNLTLGWLDRDTAAPARMLFSLVVWLFALAMAYPYFPGSDSRAFQGLSVLVGLMVSLGASGTVSQAASGLILMFSRAFRVGEYVRIQEHEGTVMAISPFLTRIRTGMGEEIVLPNSYVLASASKNYSRALPGAGFVLDTVVTIGYDVAWRQVEAMLLEAARRTPGILAEPAARVMMTALSDFYPEYRLIAYASPTMPHPRAVALSQLHTNIVDVFNEHGVQIMSPHYLGDPAREKVVPKARWYAAPAKPPAG